MIDSPSFDLVDELLGCRTDDVRLVELHQAYGLVPPPMFYDRDDWKAMGGDELGWSVTYQATVRVPGRYPSIRVRGCGPVLGYLTEVSFLTRYTGLLRGGLTTTLPEPEARTQALDSSVDRFGNPVHVLHSDDRSTLKAHYFSDGRLIHFLLTLNELAGDDPELLRAAERARMAAPASRVIPPLVEPSANEPFPGALQALCEHQDARGLGKIDFEVYERFDLDGPSGWTGNPEAEREFRVFGCDGSGGLVAFWLVHDGRPVDQQPVVLLGSEGVVGPVAPDLCDLLYLLAAGIGPFEAVMYGVADEDADSQSAIAHIAETHLGRREGRTPEAILNDAEEEYSDIRDRIDVLSRY